MRQAVSVDQRDCPEDTWDEPEKGTLRWKTLFSAGQTGTESLVCGIAMMAPGEHFALHHHPEPEVYFGLEGEAEVMIDGVAHRLAPGIALFIPGHALHGVPCSGPHPVRWFYKLRPRYRSIRSMYKFAPPPGVPHSKARPSRGTQHDP
ncbi:MAG: cupin domain-containing protein [Gemmobacter sp.]|nr:cupin domain-containing protein [Gemmobacter sp.]